MTGVVLENAKEKIKSTDSSSEFETYLQTRRENTTYNGIELENASWQKDVLGISK